MSMLWSSVNEALWFAAGFLLFRLALRCNLLPSSLEPSWLLGRQPSKNKSLKGGKSPISPSKPSCPSTKVICAHHEAGNLEGVLAKWTEVKDKVVLKGPALEAVAEALALQLPGQLCELTDYLALHPVLAKTTTVQNMVSSILKADRPDLAQEFVAELEARKMQSAVTTKIRDLVLGHFALKGCAGKVNTLLNRREMDGEEWLSGANAAVKGYLSGGHVDLALQHSREMQKHGKNISPTSATALLDASSKKELSLSDVLTVLEGASLPMEAAGVAMTACFKTDDMPSARLLEERLRRSGQVSFAVLEPLLKLAAKHDEAWAQSLLQEMQARNMFLSEGLCGLVLSRCGEARHIQLAEAIQSYLRDRKMTSLATYKTLMKVYATCDLLDRACDLYEDILADGVVPDNVMYGCLAKFAAKCGRDDLSDRLFSAASDKPQGSDVQNYMWLIRSAGQRHDVQRAVSLLRQLQHEKASVVDPAIYNCVLDVCMSNGATSEAERIFQEMLQNKLVTLITYNTLMKGYCAKGDLARARRLIRDMQDMGLRPNSASYNCLLSAAVGGGDHKQAWGIVESMRSSGVEADSFTVCILMKIVRKASNRTDAQRALAVLDSAKVDICKDEILLNTVLDACIHLKDTRRLSWILREFESATLVPSVQNYGLIIKAYSCLKQTKKCWSVWYEMTDKRQRGLVPSDVALSCMLDSIVTAGQVEEAVALFEQWRNVVPPNTIIYSNIIKGFASQGDADRALDMYHQLRADGLKMNLVAYSTLIDAQARAGKMDRAHGLLEEMKEDGVEPNTITYSSLVKGHCKEGDLDGALKLFDKMVASGVQPDTVMYNTLLDGAVRACRFSLCDQFLKEMQTTGTEPSNFTLSIVVKMWGKRKKLDKAFQAVRAHAEARSLQLDSKLCTCLISACFHNADPQRALAALKEMKTWPNCDGPDAGTYEQLTEQLVKVQLLQEAAGVVKEAVALAGNRSIKPLNPNVLRLLRRSLEQCGQSWMWSSIREQLQAARLPMP